MLFHEKCSRIDLINYFCRNKYLMRRYTNTGENSQQSPQQAPSGNHNSTNKITISFPPPTQHYDQEDYNTPVQVYLHSHNNKSVKIQLQPKISISEVKSIVEDKIGIRQDRQMLYLNGKNITEYGHIRLQPNSIIHISNIQQICDSNQEIQLKVTIMNFIDQKQQKAHKNFKALPNQRVSEFLVRLQKEVKIMYHFYDQNVQCFLLESSRLLERQKTFFQQDVTRQSDIVCIVTEHEVKTRFTNDTKQDILHDISELLGFSQNQSKTQAKSQEISIRPRYFRQQVKQQQSRKAPEEESCPYSSAQSLSSLTVPNFKKKPNPICKAISFQESPNSLAKKIRSSKPKRDLDLLLSSQQKQKLVFQSPDKINEQGQELQKKQEKAEKKQTPNDVIKATPQIPKVMPINERRQIRLEIQKLFDFGGSQKPKATIPESLEAKEQKKPISPATQVSKPKQNMRLSMGSRPAFLDQLRNLKDQ